MTDENVDKAGDGKEPKKGAPPAAPSHTTLEQFGDILREVNGEKPKGKAKAKSESSDEGDDDDAPAKKPKPKTVRELAETLELADEEVYALEIPSSREGQKPYTLGQLKDLAAGTDDLEVRNLKFENDRQEFERERVAAEAELRELLEGLPKEAVSPDSMKKLRKRISERHALERRAMLEEIEGWDDTATREADIQGMIDHLGGYGLKETVLLEQFSSGFYRFVRDAWRTATMVKKALAAVEERKNKGRPPAEKRDGGAAPRKPAAKTSGGRKGGQVSAFINTINEAAANARKH